MYRKIITAHSRETIKDCYKISIKDCYKISYDKNGNPMLVKTKDKGKEISLLPLIMRGTSTRTGGVKSYSYPFLSRFAKTPFGNWVINRYNAFKGTPKGRKISDLLFTMHAKLMPGTMIGRNPLERSLMTSYRHLGSRWHDSLEDSFPVRTFDTGSLAGFGDGGGSQPIIANLVEKSSGNKGGTIIQ